MKRIYKKIEFFGTGVNSIPLTIPKQFEGKAPKMALHVVKGTGFLSTAVLDVKLQGSAEEIPENYVDLSGLSDTLASGETSVLIEEQLGIVTDKIRVSIDCTTFDVNESAIGEIEIYALFKA